MAMPLLPSASALTGEERLRLGQGGQARLATTQQLKDFAAPAAVPGPKGLSAFDVAKMLGYPGDEAAWLASLKGKDGKDGTNGTNGTNGKDASTYLGAVTVAETAVVAIGAGIRRVVITVPVSYGVKPGQALLLVPNGVPSGSYATHDVYATADNIISVGVTVPSLVLGASYSIPCKLHRLTV